MNDLESNDLDQPSTEEETSLQDKKSYAELFSQLVEIQSTLSQLQETFEEKQRYDGFKDQQIKQLSEMVDTYKAGISYPVLRSFAIQIHRYREALSQFANSDVLQGQPVAHELALFVSELDEILRDQGFIVAVSEPESLFNASQQQATLPVSTPDESLAGRIVSSKKSGLNYQKADGAWITVVPERVDVYKFLSNIEGDNQ